MRANSKSYATPSGFTSQRFIDSRTGEIVTTIKLSEIAYFDKYSGDSEPGEFDCVALSYGGAIEKPSE